MSAPLIVGVVLIFLVLVAGTGLVLLQQLKQERLYAVRLAMIRGETPIEDEPDEPRPLQAWLMRTVAALGQVILRSGLLSNATKADLERALANCGLHGSNGLAVFVGAKILLIVGLPAVTIFIQNNMTVGANMRIVVPAVAAVGGLLLPDWLVNKRRAQIMERLEQGLPDALDMMVIRAQAGLGLGPTIIRVGTELVHAHPDIARELMLTADDLQIMSDSRVALGNLGSRTGVESIRRLVTALIQTMIYGTPLTEALRMLSAEMRQEVLTRFEARAARLPVLLTLPTVVFILPCVFLIVGGPAVMQVMHAFGGM